MSEKKKDCFVKPATVSDSITLHYKSNISNIIGELITLSTFLTLRISVFSEQEQTPVAAMHYEGLSLIYMLQPLLAKEIRQYDSPHDIQSNL